MGPDAPQRKLRIGAYTGDVARDAASLLLADALWVAFLSVVAFVAYGVDKRRAKHGARRIRERTLHRLAWLGGAPGAWAGRQLLRHKTRKRVFAVHLTAATVLHLGIAAGLSWLTYAQAIG